MMHLDGIHSLEAVRRFNRILLINCTNASILASVICCLLLFAIREDTMCFWFQLLAAFFKLFLIFIMFFPPTLLSSSYLSFSFHLPSSFPLFCSFISLLLPEVFSLLVSPLSISPDLLCFLLSSFHLSCSPLFPFLSHYLTNSRLLLFRSIRLVLLTNLQITI